MRRFPFKLLISREEALKLILNSVNPIERKESILIEDSIGRVLAEKIVADKDVPPFDRAAVDGYSVKAENTYGASSLDPKTLKLVGTLQAGQPENIPLKKGECIRIATGCPIPSGSDSVIMMEFTEETNNEVSIFKSVAPGANIALKGEDMKARDIILEERDILKPAKVGVLAALGRQKVDVYQKPRVIIIPTGNEVCEVGSKLGEGQIYDVNSYTLSSVLTENGAMVTRSSIIPDSFDQLKSAIKSFLNYDLIVFSGGSSVGERDLLVKVIK